MSIRAFRGEDRTICPAFYCDVCFQRITNPELAMAVFLGYPEAGYAVPVVHIHKGKCDRTRESSLPWDEFTYHLAHLIRNVEMTGEDVEEAGRKSDEMHSMLGF